MTLPIVVRPEAADDLVKARDWYEQQLAGLGSAFSTSIEEILGRIVKMPQMYAVALHSVRRGKIRKFRTLSTIVFYPIELR